MTTVTSVKQPSIENTTTQAPKLFGIARNIIKCAGIVSTHWMTHHNGREISSRNSYGSLWGCRPTLTRQAQQRKKETMATKIRPTSIGHLVTLEGSASTWRSVKAGDTMYIYHYSTLMAEVTDRELVQVSLGWGSMSDKCGLSKLRAGALRNGLATRVEIRG